MRSQSGSLSPVRAALSVLVLLFTFTGLASSQTSNAPPQQSATTETNATQQPQAQNHKADDTAAQKAANHEAMSPEEARQAQLAADTNKLFQLAQELQAEVAKSGKNTLSIAVVKKAAEVEKLAKSLKERMKSE